MRNYKDEDLWRLVERPSAYNMVTQEDWQAAVDRINAGSERPPAQGDSSQAGGQS